MKKIIVAGGGLAGLSVAVFLSRENYPVTLLESSRKLGGRAYSAPVRFTPAAGNSEILELEIDNGQHILMGCYDYTLPFIRIIGSYQKLLIQKRLSVEYTDERGASHTLRERALIYPLGLLQGILSYSYLSAAQKLRLLFFLSKLPFIDPRKYDGKSVTDLLSKYRQTGKIYSGMWEPVTIGAMNSQPEKADAGLFIRMLKQIFLRDGFSSRIMVPAVPFRELYTADSESYIQKNGGEVIKGEGIKELLFNENRLTVIRTDKRDISDFDTLVLAVSPFSLSKIKGMEKVFPDGLPEFEYSSITGIHLALKEKGRREGFTGFVNSPLHWVFYKEDHISCIISDSDSLINTEPEDIYKLALKELTERGLFKPSDFTGYKVIKEKRATFIPDSSNLSKRPVLKTPFTNLILAGDYTDTALPATIEGAVKSGVNAAEFIAGRPLI